MKNLHNYENSIDSEGDKLVDGNSIYQKTSKVVEESVLVTESNAGFFSYKKKGEKVLRKTFYFDQWTIEFIGTSKKIVVDPKILTLYENGDYIMNNAYHSGLFASTRTTPRAYLFLTIKFKQSQYTIKAIRSNWPIGCGNFSHEFSGNISKDFYNNINTIVLNVDGGLFVCKN